MHINTQFCLSIHRTIEFPPNLNIKTGISVACVPINLRINTGGFEDIHINEGVHINYVNLH